MGFLLIFDVTNEKSFLDISDWISQLRVHAYCENPDIILCGNKSDLTHLRVVSEERARTVAERFELPYIEISAATGQNIRIAVEILLGRVMTRIDEAAASAVLPGRRGRPKELGSVVDLDRKKQTTTGLPPQPSKKCAC